MNIQYNMSAKLYYIYGTMNTSKSASLLMKAHSFEENDIPFICMKPSIDNRDGIDVISSRIGLKKECVSIYPGDDIFDIINEIINEFNTTLRPLPKWILLDESQFLTEKQVDQLSKVVDLLHINVICYGLRTDFRTRLFPGSKRLFELADNIEEMKISCRCGGKAIINARINEDGHVITDGDQVMIGGNDKYITLCRKCYRELVNNSNL